MGGGSTPCKSGGRFQTLFKSLILSLKVGQNVYEGGVGDVMVCKPNLVFCLPQSEQLLIIFVNRNFKKTFSSGS